jgi:SOS-response transcriptional repressor LexA
MRAAILAFIGEYAATHGWAPTVREIAAGTGASSTSLVIYHLRALERSGRIVRGSGARALRIVALGTIGPVDCEQGS